MEQPTLQIKEKNGFLYVSFGNSQIVSKGKEKSGILIVRFETFNYFNEKLLHECLNYWELHGTALNCKAVIIDTYQLNNFKMSLLAKRNYQMSTHIKERDRWKVTLSVVLYKSLAKGAIGKIMKRATSIHTFLEEIQKNEPTFSYVCEQGLLLGDILFYYKGEEHRLLMDYDAPCFTMRLEGSDKVYRLKEAEEIPKALQVIFDQAEKRARMKTIFSPPEKYFRLISRKFSLPWETIDQIHQQLLEIFSWQEIENYAARFYKRNAEVSYFRHDDLRESIVEYMGEFFLIDTEKNVGHYGASQKEELFQWYEQRVMEVVKRQLTKDFQQFSAESEHFSRQSLPTKD